MSESRTVLNDSVIERVIKPVPNKWDEFVNLFGWFINILYTYAMFIRKKITFSSKTVHFIESRTVLSDSVIEWVIKSIPVTRDYFVIFFDWLIKTIQFTRVIYLRIGHAAITHGLFCLFIVLVSFHSIHHIQLFLSDHIHFRLQAHNSKTSLVL